MRTITCDLETMLHLLTPDQVIYATVEHYVPVAEGEQARTEEMVTNVADLESGHLFVLSPPVAEPEFLQHYGKAVQVGSIQ